MGKVHDHNVQHEQRQRVMRQSDKYFFIEFS